jgi:gas vesicle protein
MEENKSLAYFFLGLGAGVAIGMIFAPKAGAETRTMIRSRASESGDYIRRRGTQLREGASGLIDKSKDVVTRQREQLGSAVEAGRQAYREKVGGTGTATPDADTAPTAEGL